MILAYTEFVDFIAGGITPQGVIDFRPSEEARARVADLIRHQKLATLSLDQTAELNQILLIEHIMRLAKARARQRLAAPSRSTGEVGTFLED
jgi:hypothetical protein